MFTLRQFAAVLFGSIVSTICCAQPLLVSPMAESASVEPAAPAVPNPSAPPVTPASPAADARAQNSEHLQVALRKLEAGGTTDSAAAHEVAFYQTREAVLTQQEAVEQQIKDLQIRKAELEAKQKLPFAADSVAEISFAELDQLKDDLAAEEARLNLINDKFAATKAGVEKASAARDESDVKQRQTQETRDAAKNKPEFAQLATSADRARLNALLAADSLNLRKRELERDRLAQEVQTLVVQVLRNQVAQMTPLVVFTEADYQREIDDIRAKEDSANKLLQTRQSSLQRVNEQLGKAQAALNQTTGDRTIAIEALEAERRAREKLTDEIDCLTQRLQRLAQLRLAWNYRYKLSLNKDKTDNPDLDIFSKLKALQQETKGILSGLAEDMRMEILRMRDLRTSLTAVTKKIEAAKDIPAALQESLNRQQYQLEQTLRIHERNLVMIETSRRVHEKLLDEIGRGVEALTPKRLAYEAWHTTKRIWNFELANISDRSITVGKIVTGIMLFIGGWIVSRFLSGLFAVRLLKRFKLSKDATSAIRTLAFYLLLTIVVLHALLTVGIPLTAFTVLGGALAIGVGFGSQALVNNFIGGLIMLAERPVRLGERITFGNFDGVVEDVGFRCTKLRTQSDHLVTIPNSTLVNESIENVDRRRTIRRVVNIQITYNITQERLAAAVQAIREILEEKGIRERIHPIIGFEEFLPRVHFTDFLAESLNIQVTYWYAPVDGWAYLDHCERVNFRIMEELDRLGVDFAFPSKTPYVSKPSRLGGSSFAA